MINSLDDWTDGDAVRSHVGIVLGLWLSGVFAASLGGWFEHDRDNTVAMGFLGAAVIWPLWYFAFGRAQFIPRSMSFGAMGALVLFVLAAALSCIVSPVMLRSIGYVGLTFAGIWLALQFNSALDAEQCERGMKLFAVLTAGLLLTFAWYDYTPGKRLGTGRDVLNPNTIALVSTSVMLSAMAIRTLVLRLTVMAPIAAVIVLTGSRAAAIAALAGLATIVWRRLRAKQRPVLLLAAVGLALAVTVTISYGDVMYETLDRMYALSTADRGLGSGATGRITAWKSTWELFARNPMLGVGFRAHEQYLKVDTSAHNGYLATLAEVGIIGFLAVLYLVVRGLRILMVRSREPEAGFTNSILFGLCVAYLLLAVFERYLINVGNPTSLLFLVGIMRPGEMGSSALESDELRQESFGESTLVEPTAPVYGQGSWRS